LIDKFSRENFNPIKILSFKNKINLNLKIMEDKIVRIQTRKHPLGIPVWQSTIEKGKKWAIEKGDLAKARPSLDMMGPDTMHLFRAGLLPKSAYKRIPDSEAI
jgi:hypothetical protein